MASNESNDSTLQQRAHPSGEGATFGEELRREREMRGIDLAEVAEATKVSRRFLEALESNDFEILPGGLFTRGFIRAYASHIGADPDRLVNAYLLQISRDDEREEAEAHSGPRLESTPEATGGGSSRRGNWVLLLAAVAVAVAVAVGLFALQPELLSGADVPPLTAPEPTPASSASEPERAVTEPGRVLELQAEAGNRVRVTCDGATRIDRTLAAGERVTVRCNGELRLDATSGGDLQLTLDGEALGPPGEHGSPLVGWSPPEPGPPMGTVAPAGSGEPDGSTGSEGEVLPS